MDNSCKVPEVKPITIKRFGTAGLVPTVPTTLDCNLWQKTDLKDGEFAINTVDDKLYIRSGNQIIELTNQSSGGSTGTVTSVGLSMPSAFAVANSPVTSSGTLTVTGAGVVSQYIRGDGSLANFPASTGGGASQSFYLNGSVSQGTFGGVAFREMDRVPILGAGTDFTINTNGYIQSFITDAGVPNLLEIPAGNWNFETYFSASSGGGSPSFYLELYKWDGATLSLIASNSATPESITNGTAIDLYVSALAVPQTTLLATDRLAVRIYVNNSGRTITLHTENNHLCQIITTFSTGLNALNGLTAQVQNFAVGTSGTDFAINSVTDTHTFNLPTASALNRGALSSADWSTFNGKVSTGVITGSGLTMATARLLGRSTAGSGAVEEITIGSGLTLSAGTLTAAGGAITIGTTAIASGTVNRILFQGAGDVVQQDSTFVWNNTNKRLILGTEAVADANTRLVITGSGSGSSTTTFGLKVHNSTGTNNALVVRDDGFIGIGINEPNAAVKGTTFRVRGGTNDYLQFTTDGGVFAGLSNTHTSISNLWNQVVIGGSNNVSTTNVDNQYAVAIGYLNTVGGGSVVIGKGIDVRGVGTTAQGKVAIGLNINTLSNARTIAIGSEMTMGSSNGIAIGTHIGVANLNNNNNHIYGNFFDASTSTALNRAIVMGQGVSDVSRAAPRINDSFSIYFQDLQRSFFVNKNSNIVLRSLQALTAGTQYDNTATNTLTLHNGVAPATNIADAFQLYSTDRVAGQAGAVIRSENGTQHIFSDRVGIRTITPNATLQINGEGTGALATTFGLQVHDSTGTNNALVVRDDGFVGFGTATPVATGVALGTNVIRANISSTNYLSLFSNGAVLLGAGAATTGTGTAGIGIRCIAIGFNAEANTTGNQGVDQQGIAIGQSALAYGGGIAIGSAARTGFSAITGAGGAIAIGHNVSSSSSGTGTPANIAIGSSASILQSCINIGRGNTFTGSNFNGTGYHTILGSNLTINSASSRNSIVALGYGNNTPITIGNSFQIYLAGQAERSLFLNSNGNIVLRNNQTIVSATNFDANATNTITINNGTAPATNIATSFQLYSNNISGAGTAAPHFRNENGNVIKIYQETTGIAAAAFVANTSLIADDTATFGGYTIGQVVAALKAQGLLA